MTRIEAQGILARAVQPGRYRFIADAELPDATEALRAAIGKEAKLPSWQRRLAVTTVGTKQYLLVIQGCLGLVENTATWLHPEMIATSADPIPIALPIAGAIELLASDQSPEKERERRAALIEKHAIEEAEKARVAAAKSAAEIAEKHRVQRERYDFKADHWAQLSPMERFAARLAVLVESRDACLAGDIRAAIAGAGDAKDFPRSAWWAGIERATGLQTAAAKEAELAAIQARNVAEATVLRIPAETRLLLGIQHGPQNYEAIARAWEALESQRQKAPKQNARASQ